MTKFKNEKTGRYRSKLESQVRKKFPKKLGLKIGYESTTLTYITTHDYIPDFTIELPNGHIIYIEVKGWFRQEDKRKMAAVKKHHPEKDIRFVFSSKNAKNFRWCERHGYLYAVGKAPEEWFR